MEFLLSENVVVDIDVDTLMYYNGGAGSSADSMVREWRCRGGHLIHISGY